MPTPACRSKHPAFCRHPWWVLSGDTGGTLPGSLFGVILGAVWRERAFRELSCRVASTWLGAQRAELSIAWVLWSNA